MTDPWRTLGQMARCGWRVLALASRGELHRRRGRVGSWVRLPDGRCFQVFRETTSDAGSERDRVVVAVWFHLKGVPAGARIRRAIFERESILNTLLFAGFDGFRIKLWMVDPASSDFAGLYEWSDPGQAEIYARYITTVLARLSRSGSVGYQIVADETLVGLPRGGVASRRRGGPLAGLWLVVRSGRIGGCPMVWASQARRRSLLSVGFVLLVLAGEWLGHAGVVVVERRGGPGSGAVGADAHLPGSGRGRAGRGGRGHVRARLVVPGRAEPLDRIVASIAGPGLASRTGPAATQARRLAATLGEEPAGGSSTDLDRPCCRSSWCSTWCRRTSSCVCSACPPSACTSWPSTTACRCPGARRRRLRRGHHRRPGRRRVGRAPGPSLGGGPALRPPGGHRSRRSRPGRASVAAGPRPAAASACPSWPGRRRGGWLSEPTLRVLTHPCPSRSRDDTIEGRNLPCHVFPRRLAGATALATTLLVLLASPALAHETRQVGSYSVAVGWSHEPAYAGAENGVQIFIHDASGAADRRPGLTHQPRRSR